jgi:hypothetical protein
MPNAQAPVLDDIEAHLARMREAGELDDVGEGVLRRHFQARADQLANELRALLPEYQRRVEDSDPEAALQWLAEAAEALGRRDGEETRRVLGTVVAS